MDRGMYVAMTGAKQIMQAQALNNNNIANANTTGFRADSVQFTSNPIYGPGYATRVNAVASDAGTDFSSGVLINSSSSLDIAINGSGFIAVQGADGREGYTRSGDLHVTADGLLVSSSGQQVLSESGPITVPSAASVTIGGDGTVSVVPLGLAAAAQSQIDRIKLVNPSVKALQKGSDGLLYLKAGGKAPADESVNVVSGELESSNVNAAMALVNMIDLQRQYEFQIRSINSADTDEQAAERLMSATS